MNENGFQGVRRVIELIERGRDRDLREAERIGCALDDDEKELLALLLEDRMLRLRAAERETQRLAQSGEVADVLFNVAWLIAAAAIAALGATAATRWIWEAQG